MQYTITPYTFLESLHNPRAVTTTGKIDLSVNSDLTTVIIIFTLNELKKMFYIRSRLITYAVNSIIEHNPIKAIITVTKIDFINEMSNA